MEGTYSLRCIMIVKNYIHDNTKCVCLDCRSLFPMSASVELISWRCVPVDPEERAFIAVLGCEDASADGICCPLGCIGYSLRDIWLLALDVFMHDGMTVCKL